MGKGLRYNEEGLRYNDYNPMCLLDSENVPVAMCAAGALRFHT